MGLGVGAETFDKKPTVPVFTAAVCNACNAGSCRAEVLISPATPRRRKLSKLASMCCVPLVQVHRQQTGRRHSKRRRNPPRGRAGPCRRTGSGWPTCCQLPAPPWTAPLWSPPSRSLCLVRGRIWGLQMRWRRLCSRSLPAQPLTSSAPGNIQHDGCVDCFSAAVSTPKLRGRFRRAPRIYESHTAHACKAHVQP